MRTRGPTSARPHLRLNFFFGLFVHVAVRIEIASVHFSRQNDLANLHVNDSLERQTCRRLVLVVTHQRGIQHIQFQLGRGERRGGYK